MTNLLECGHPESPHSEITRGYGTDKDGNRHCYDCCAERDRQQMIADGRITLYLAARKRPEPSTVTDYFITNWPGSLEFKAWQVTGSEYGGGFGSQRTDAWFTGPDGKQWHAINRGDNEIARCRRLKS